MTPHTLDTIRQINNPAERVKAALEVKARADTVSSAAVRIKDLAVTELLDQGCTVAEIVAATGISASQVKTTRRLLAVRSD
jgi:uncharacterized protein YerC